MRRSSIVAGVLVLFGYTTLTGCSGTAEPRIRDYPPDAGASLGQVNTLANTPYTFDDATLCLTHPGTVTVDDVEVVNPTGGLRVTDFAVRPARNGMLLNYIDDPRQRLAEVGFPTTGPVILDRTCPPEDLPPGHRVSDDYALFLLGVEVRKPKDSLATGGGFLITYHSGDDTHQMYVPFGILLCHDSECDVPSPQLIPPDSS